MNAAAHITTITFACLSLLLTACSKPEQETNEGAGTDTEPEIRKALNDVDNYLLGLTPWTELSPKVIEDNGTAVGDASKSEAGKYECLDQKYSLAKNPQQVVLFGDNPALWPGAVIQGKPFLNGQFVQFPADIAPLELTMNTLNTHSSTTIDNPSAGTIHEAISQLVANAKDSQYPSKLDYLSKEIYSVEQLFLDFNLSAKYINQSAKASVQLDSKIETKTFSYYLVQNMFTVSVPPPKTPSRYFNKVTMDDIEDQQAIGRINQDNPPLYVESVTYGLILLFTLTSSSSQTDIKAALEYAYSGGADIDAKSKAKYKKLLNSAEIKIVQYGGPYDRAAELIKSADIKSYFGDQPALTTAVPISYTLNTLARGATATVAETTSYIKRDCKLKPTPAIKNNASFSLQYVGGGDNRYLSIVDWRAVGLTGKWPYPTLQLKPVKLKFKGSGKPLTHGMNIRFKTTEKKSQGKDIGKYNELGRWAAKPKVFYAEPEKSKKQNWIFTKACKAKGANKCDNYIRYGDNIHIRSEYKPKQYLCNDSSGKSIYIVTKEATCTWKILK